MPHTHTGAIVGMTGDKLPMSTQIMMFGAGLRGAVALALVMQMPTSSAEEIASATLFVVFWTNIVLGGLTTPLVLWLKVKNIPAIVIDSTDHQLVLPSQAA